MTQNATQIRTRFAPSPTGHLHIGNARTAIMNWLCARHLGGKFILRIEDTDKERSTRQSEENILNDLKWLGLLWDEGPDAGGDYGPYRQSERLEIYQSLLNQLVDDKKAYPCYCTAEELETRRQEQLEKGRPPHYDGRCRSLSEAQKSAFVNEGREPVIRFHVQADQVSFHDLVKGDITVQKENLGDFVLARPGGMPMYNFACVADDHLMNISHVIRGDDHVSNTPRQVMIYRALGWEPPQFAHIPMILGKDRNRLSKRHGATSVSQYRDAGYLPETLMNFLSLLSWSSESGDEILSAERLISEFDFGRISRSPSVFNVEKLDWMNGVYIRNLALENLVDRALPFLQKAGYPVKTAEEILPIIEMLQEKIEQLSQIAEKARLFFEPAAVPENEEAASLVKSDESKSIFSAFLKVTESLSDWDGEAFKNTMKAVQSESGVKGKGLWMPVRVALTGQLHGPDLAKTAVFFGLQECRKRIEAAL